jgi:hypothetical protein
MKKRKQKRNPFFGTNLGRRASITSLGGETRRVPLTLPRVSILETKYDDDECRATEASS